MQQPVKTSLAEYANGILNDSRVKELLSSITISNEVAEKVIASVPLEMGKESFLYAHHYIDALRQAKRSSLIQIVEQAMPWKWMPLSIHIIAAANGTQEEGEPQARDLPFLMFCFLLLDPDFQPYVLEGKLPWLLAPLPARKDRVDLFVVSLFLWLKMDWRYSEERRVSYYVRAEEKSKKKRDISTVESRERFLYLFGEYLHTDLWTATDYNEQGKEGTVLRLRVTDARSGLIVVQSCGKVSNECNNLYMVTAEVIEQLRNTLLASNVLTRSAPPNASTFISFQCSRCGDGNACLFHPSDTTRFYCNAMCYEG